MPSFRSFARTPRVQLAALIFLMGLTLIRSGFVVYTTLPDLNSEASRYRLILTLVLSAVVIFMLARFARHVISGTRSSDGDR